MAREVRGRVSALPASRPASHQPFESAVQRERAGGAGMMIAPRGRGAEGGEVTHRTVGHRKHLRGPSGREGCW